MTHIDDILKLANTYYNKCNEDLVKLARIRKLPDGKYRVLSEKGKNLGTYKSRDGAKKRLKQVEYFKHFDHANAEDDTSIIDLTKLEVFSYSALMRQLRQHASKEQVKDFLKIFKLNFDKAIKEKLHKPERIALQNSLVKFNKIHKVKVNKKIVKSAAISELGDAVSVGKYLSDIVKFTMNRISPDKRPNALAKMKVKLYNLSENEIASKEMPPSSAMGQSITFVKTVLFNHDAGYVREVINNLVRNL